MNTIVEAVGTFRNWLKGKKTYLICGGVIIGVALAWSEGDVSNVEALQAIFEAVVGMTIRAGISKVLG